MDSAVLGDVFAWVGEVEVVEVGGFVVFESTKDVGGWLDDGDCCGGDRGVERVCFSGGLGEGGCGDVSPTAALVRSEAELYAEWESLLTWWPLATELLSSSA